MMNKEDTGASSLREDRVTAADRQHARKPAMNPACPLCGEPTSLDHCAACVEPEASRLGAMQALRSRPFGEGIGVTAVVALFLVFCMIFAGV